MTEPHVSRWTRRRLLKTGLTGSFALAVAGVAASMTRWSGVLAGNRRHILEDDLPMLRAIIPEILHGAVPREYMHKATEQTINSLDYSLTHFSPAMRREIRRLFDLLTLPLPRRLATGIWNNWTKASDVEVQQFLQGWKNSRITLLQSAYAALVQIITMAWYAQPDSWQHCGYPGPPRV